MWKEAARYAVIGALIIGAALLAVFIFDAVWARAGFIAAAVLVAVALFILKKWMTAAPRKIENASSAANVVIALAFRFSALGHADDYLGAPDDAPPAAGPLPDPAVATRGGG